MRSIPRPQSARLRIIPRQSGYIIQICAGSRPEGSKRKADSAVPQASKPGFDLFKMPNFSPVQIIRKK